MFYIYFIFISICLLSRKEKKLIEEKNWPEELLPKERTISNILNRMGYKLRKVQKAKPKKKYRKLTPYSTTLKKLEKQPVSGRIPYKSA